MTTLGRSRHERDASNQSAVDDKSLDHLYWELGPVVHRYCLLRIAQRADAEDVAATVMERATRSFRRDQPDDAAVRAWILRIAHNAVVDHLRARERGFRLLQTLVRAGTPNADPESAAIDHLELAAVLSALRKLHRRDRELIALRVGVGLPYSEVAAQMNMTENAATVATGRALRRLRAAVGERE